jgi:hypothetical protein
MRFLVNFAWRPGAGSEADQARILSLFAKWQPPLELHEWSGFADGSGGMAIVETEDVDVLAGVSAPWTPWLDYTVRALVPIEQFGAVMSDAASFRSSVT